MTTFDFREFLVVAEDLFTRGDQASYRTALSRAYYAVFGVAWHTLPPSLQTHIGQGRVHRETWSHYSGSSYLPCRQVAGVGGRLRILRHEADYQDAILFTTRRVRNALDEADQALQLLYRHGYQL